MALALAPESRAQERKPPHNLEAERAVLGSVMVKPSLFDRVSLELQVDEFFLPAHREIYESMLELQRRDRPIDVVMLMDEMRARRVLDRLEGGETYLLHLDVPSPENVDHYVGVVQEKARLRTLISVCSEAASSAYGDAESAELLETLSEKTLRLVSRRKGDLHHVGPELMPLMEDFEARRKRREAGDENAGVTGVRTGISKLDRLTCGAQPGDMVVIAGGTGTGKTAFANQSALNLCLDGGTGLIFNLEMTRRQLVERGMVHLAEINSALLREGRIEVEEFKRLQKAASRLYDTSLFIHDDCYTVRDIFATARRWRMRHPTKKGLLVVDFIQLMRGAGMGHKENRAREIGLFAQGLKELAKELGVAVFALSQLNRSGMKSSDRPTKYDLKESGDIENAADVILLLHNPDEVGEGHVDCYVDKNRNGECKRVRMHWRGRFYQFSNPDITAQEETRYGE